MSTKLFPIKLATTSNDLLMNTLALFKHSHVGTYIQQPHKNNKNWPHNFLLHLLKYFYCFLPLLAFHMSQYHGHPNDHILKWHLVEHSPCILNVPIFYIHVNKVIAHKDIRFTTSLNELFMNKLVVFKCS